MRGDPSRWKRLLPQHERTPLTDRNYTGVVVNIARPIVVACWATPLPSKRRFDLPIRWDIRSAPRGQNGFGEKEEGAAIGFDPGKVCHERELRGCTDRPNAPVELQGDQ